jgi:hypothetical protein
MTPYPPDIEAAMITFLGSLREKDRRRYAAVEAAKLGSGGLAYLSRLLGIDSHTIRRGQDDLRHLPDVPPERVRNKGADENANSTPRPRSPRTCGTSSTSTRPAAPPNPTCSGPT